MMMSIRLERTGVVVGLSAMLQVVKLASIWYVLGKLLNHRLIATYDALISEKSYADQISRGREPESVSSNIVLSNRVGDFL